MTLADIRDVLVNQLEGGWIHPSVKIYYENTDEVDIAQVGDYYIKCEILFDRAEQINVAENPDHRTYGTLALRVFARHSRGKRALLVYLGELTELMKFKNLNGVHLKVPSPGGESNLGGWFSMELRTPFYADSNA